MSIYVNESCIAAPTTGTFKDHAIYSSNGYIQLTDANNNEDGEFEYNQLLPINFQVNFDFWMGPNNSGADAIAFYFGCSTTPTSEDENGPHPGGYQLAFDEYSGEGQPFQVNFNGVTIANSTGSWPYSDSSWHTAQIIVNNNLITFYVDNQVVYSYQDIARTLPGNLFGWVSRTGGVNNEHRIRNLKVQSYPISTQLQTPIVKRFYYKIYNNSLSYITTWSEDVITDPTYRTVVNGGAGQLLVRLARPFDNFGEGNDVALQNRIELWCADGDNLTNNSSSGTLWDTALWDVDLWDNPVYSFIKLFAGYISAYAPIINNEKQYVEVTVLGYVTETQRRILKDTSNNTTVTYTNKDPGTIFKDIIDKYRADGGVNINYLGSSIQFTGTNVTYTFRANTLKECFDKLIELSPDGYFWFIDPTGTVFFKQASTTADHTLTIGKDISYLQTTKRIENVINQVFVIGGGNPNYYTEYSRSSSVSAYGKFESKIQDGKVTDNATSDVMAKHVLDQNQNPETRTILRVIDNNGENSGYGQNIESFNVGDTIQIKNLNYGSSGLTLWDNAVWDTDVWDNTIQYTTASVLTIVSITYYPEFIEIEASSRQPEVTKRAEDINKLLLTQTQSNLPSAPTVRSV